MTDELSKFEPEPESPPITEYDGKGCPVMVWDGPYKFRCGLGARVGECAYHGPFATPAISPGSEATS